MENRSKVPLLPVIAIPPYIPLNALNSLSRIISNIRFLFNPLTLATCLGRSSSSFSNLAVLASIAHATQGKKSIYHKTHRTSLCGIPSILVSLSEKFHWLQNSLNPLRFKMAPILENSEFLRKLSLNLDGVDFVGNVGSAMVELAMATYLSLYPALLLPPLLMLCSSKVIPYPFHI